MLSIVAKWFQLVHFLPLSCRIESYNTLFYIKIKKKY